MSSSQSSWMSHVHVAQGYPHPSTDAAPTSVFLALFLLGALTNFFVLFHNKRNGKLFVFNGMCGGFCMARVITCSLRLAWMYHLTNRPLALSATIFVAAGVLILFIVNLFFSQRMLRGLHPHLGWEKGVSIAFLVLYALVPGLLGMAITATISLFHTTDSRMLSIDIDLQRAAATYFLFVSILPILITCFALIKPNTKSEVDHFGAGSFVVKAIPLLIASVLLSVGTIFRAGVSYTKYTPGTDPWWNEKWAFYFFNFGVEIAVVFLYLAVQEDKLFWVPNGSKGPGSYSAGQREQRMIPGREHSDDEEKRVESPSTSHRLSDATAVSQHPVTTKEEV